MNINIKFLNLKEIRHSKKKTRSNISSLMILHKNKNQKKSLKIRLRNQIKKGKC